ncbi:MAG: hypothetical protein H7Y43_00795 [Akkermansiaceae bacterium]|nr:hypothetical protein [Verrucomicrobiales bacterium]
MSTSAFTTVRTTWTAIEADILLGVLRAAGLHPLDLATSNQFTIAGVEGSFPIVVPTEEAAQAIEILNSHPGA